MSRVYNVHQRAATRICSNWRGGRTLAREISTVSKDEIIIPAIVFVSQCPN